MAKRFLSHPCLSRLWHACERVSLRGAGVPCPPVICPYQPPPFVMTATSRFPWRLTERGWRCISNPVTCGVRRTAPKPARPAGTRPSQLPNRDRHDGREQVFPSIRSPGLGRRFTLPRSNAVSFSSLDPPPAQSGLGHTASRPSHSPGLPLPAS